MSKIERHLAYMLLLGMSVGATADAIAQSCNPSEALQDSTQISAGGPYVANAGSPITLHGIYNVEGQSEDSDHLKMIGLAIQAYAKENGSYPPAALLNGKGQPTVSWRVLILPYLGYKDLYERFDLAKPWNDPVNLPLLWEMPSVYRRSGDAAPTETGFAGVQGVGSLFQSASSQLDGGRPLTGLSVTEKLAAGPVGRDVHLPWSAPGDVAIQKAPQLGSSHGFSGSGCAFTPLLFLDGSVHLMPNSVGAGPMITWTLFSNSGMQNKCPCAPPSSVDAGFRAVWDLGKGGTFNTQGWDVPFVAPSPGIYTVTLHASDQFGGHYQRSTAVLVR
jgi:hypothetical protein